jgi:flagellar biosynthesis protein FlhF
MKMQRYHARDMRQALAQIRAEQGPEAVILSTQRTGDGVVVCAAVDFDFTEAAAPAATPAPSFERALAQEQRTATEEHVELRATTNEKPATAERSAAAALAAASQLQNSVSDEIRSLRELLESQVAALAWNDFTRRQPLKARVLEELTNIGLSRDIALQVVGELPDGIDAEQASRLPLAQLSRRIKVARSEALERGGVLALVGPNGAGKTTTLAKFATRWVLERSSRELGLITMDRERFGSQEQLLALGRVLGVPALVADGSDGVQQALDRLRDRRLILIDTPGLSARSDRLVAELGGLARKDSGIEVGLVLPGSLQAGSLEECVTRFSTLGPSHCVLTKLDEATSLGGAVSTFARTGLPVSWLCHGARVPEDIEQARAHQLVTRAVRLARGTGASADEDLLARRFGGLAHAVA